MKKIFSMCFLAAALVSASVKAQDIQKSETLVGVGVALNKLDDGTLRVFGIIPHTPAERGGLLVNDRIVEIKSTPETQIVDVRLISLEEAVALIRGSVGVPVEISFVRGDSEKFVVNLIREKFEVTDEE